MKCTQPLVNRVSKNNTYLRKQRLQSEPQLKRRKFGFLTMSLILHYLTAKSKETIISTIRFTPNEVTNKIKDNFEDKLLVYGIIFHVHI